MRASCNEGVKGWKRESGGGEGRRLERVLQPYMGIRTAPFVLQLKTWSSFSRKHCTRVRTNIDRHGTYSMLYLHFSVLLEQDYMPFKSIMCYKQTLYSCMNISDLQQRLNRLVLRQVPELGGWRSR